MIATRYKMNSRGCNPRINIDYPATLKGSNKGKSVNQSVAMRMKLRPSFPSLRGLSPRRRGSAATKQSTHRRKRIEMGDGFIIEIMEEGKVLYEAD